MDEELSEFRNTFRQLQPRMLHSVLVSWVKAYPLFLGRTRRKTLENKEFTRLPKLLEFLVAANYSDVEDRQYRRSNDKLAIKIASSMSSV